LDAAILLPRTLVTLDLPVTNLPVTKLNCQATIQKNALVMMKVCPTFPTTVPSKLNFYFKATNISPINVGAVKTETKINILSSFFTKDKKAKATLTPEKKATTPVATNMEQQETLQANPFKEISVAIEKGPYGYGLRYATLMGGSMLCY
jgi:hypothetical protein